MNPHPSESTLRIDHEDIQKVLTRAADVLSVVDDRGRLLKVNHQACRTLGYSLGEISKLSIFDLDRELDRPQFEDLRRRANGEEVITLERRFRCKDGASLEVEVRIKSVLFSGARARLLLVAARDITERKHLQEQLVEALMRAEESSRMKQLFLSNLNHEIRTPLHVIVGYTSLISSFVQEGGDVDVASILESMERATHRLLNTIHSTLDLSKIEQGSLRLQREVLDVVSVVTTQVQSLRNDAARKGISISCELGGSPRQVRFDSYCLSNAVRKLLDNAVKFTTQGEIGIAIEDDAKGGFVLEVHDTGAGISNAYLPNLFEPFSQEDPGLTRRFEGVGIGLALAKRFVELNGASLSATSEKGKGSLFRIHFPKGIVIGEGVTASRRKRASGSALRLAAAS